MVVLTKTPHEHSPAMIPFLTELVSSILETTQEQLRYLEKAKGDAPALDDVAIHSILEIYEEQIMYLALLSVNGRIKWHCLSRIIWHSWHP